MGKIHPTSPWDPGIWSQELRMTKSHWLSLDYQSPRSDHKSDEKWSLMAGGVFFWIWKQGRLILSAFRYRCLANPSVSVWPSDGWHVPTWGSRKTSPHIALFAHLGFPTSASNAHSKVLTSSQVKIQLKHGSRLLIANGGRCMKGWTCFFPQQKNVESANQPPHDLTNIHIYRYHLCEYFSQEFRNTLVPNLAYAQAVFARFCVVKSLTFEITFPPKKKQAQHSTLKLLL